MKRRRRNSCLLNSDKALFSPKRLAGTLPASLLYQIHQQNQQSNSEKIVHAYNLFLWIFYKKAKNFTGSYATQGQFGHPFRF